MFTKLTKTSALRRSLQALAVASIVGAGLVAHAGTSSAMSPYVNTYTVRAGDCTVTAGATYDGARGWAIGAGTSNCAYRHASTKLTVRLWYSADSGRTWHYIPSTVRTTTFYNSFGFGGRELSTGGYCGGGRLQWVTEVDYSISGVGSGWVENASQGYQAGHC